MENHAVLGPHVDCYNVAKVTIGANATVSQKSYLCTASHNISDPKRRLIIAPITICDRAWVAADAFIGMGVTVGEGAVVARRPSWSGPVILGNGSVGYLGDREHQAVVVLHVVDQGQVDLPVLRLAAVLQPVF